MSVWIVEHKTTSEDCEAGSPYWQRLRLDSQVSTYYRGARALGYDVRGCLYDVIRKPSLKPYKATPVESRKFKADGSLYANQRDRDETPDEYRTRLLEDIAAKPERYYVRGEVVRTADDEHAGAADAWMIAQSIREAERLGRFPRNVDACVRYGRTCDYFEVCTGTTSLDDRLRFRVAERAHEELDGADVRRLPVLSNSEMRTFRRCILEHHYAYRCKVRTVAKADALRFGTLVHAGLEVWWRTVDLEAALAVVRRSDPDPFEVAKAEALLVGYDARWKDEPLTVLGVEVEFACELVNPSTGRASRTVRLSGKLDAIVER